ncbi:MAG TPA: MBL fold metallo-hydrolase [Vicinamibacterales bacterium]|nr:MBL fold metallo-hydrolase [Vicinamibacterales bacterium]
MRPYRSSILALLVVTGLVLPAAAQQAPTRGIVNVTGQLYRAQNNNHYTVFLVTPEGVIMSDPINRDFGRWLKAEIATRFKVPVRYVLYTHRDWDHASGGVVFADTAEFVGHRNMLAALAPPAGNPPLTDAATKMDANRNGLVERSEAAGDIADRFAQFDYNRDEVVSGAEIARGGVSDVLPPTITYTDRHIVTLGGKQVTMIHLGTAHADDSSVLHFPAERAVFSADILQVRRLPGAVAPSVGAWIDALTRINALDFDHALTGHALSGTKKDAGELLRYLQDLSAGVAGGVAAGRSLAEIQKTLTLDAFKGFERWDTVRNDHIAAVYATLRGTSPTPGTR